MPQEPAPRSRDPLEPVLAECRRLLKGLQDLAAQSAELAKQHGELAKKHAELMDTFRRLKR